MGPSVSPDGRKIAYSAGEYEWNVVEIGLTDGAVHVLVENGGTNIVAGLGAVGNAFSVLHSKARSWTRRSPAVEFSRRLDRHQLRPWGSALVAGRGAVRVCG